MAACTWRYPQKGQAVAAQVSLWRQREAAIVASKNGKFFHIQVKTATSQENGKFFFSISQASFKRYHDTNVYYVFVMRLGTRNEFVIMPSTHIEYILNAGIITAQATLLFSISADAKNSKYTLNGKHDITPFYGKFGEIIR